MMLKVFTLLLLLFSTAVYSADNTVVLTPGSGVTMRTRDVGSGVQSPYNILGDTSGVAIYGTAGTANTNVITVQGIASGTPQPITGTITAVTSITNAVTVAQATAANLNATVVGTGTFAVQATLSAETTKVIGTVNQGTSPWVVSLASTTITGTVAATQSGTWTVQPGNTANTTPWLITGSGTAGSAATGVVTIQGIASMTKLLVTPDANSAINVAQINGVTPLMGNGTTGTGSPRVTLVSDGTAISTAGYMSIKVDQTTPGTTNAVSLAQIGSTTISAGNGVSGNGVQRVAIASDNTAFSVNAQYGGTALVADPCQAIAKTYTPISITTATTTRIVAPAASKKTYICYMILTSAAADNIGVVEGTGGTCGSGTAGVIGGTTAANGPNFAANGGFSIGNGASAVAATAGTNVDLCLITSAATPLAGHIAWVQQ